MSITSKPPFELREIAKQAQLFETSCLKNSSKSLLLTEYVKLKLSFDAALDKLQRQPEAVKWLRESKTKALDLFLSTHSPSQQKFSSATPTTYSHAHAKSPPPPPDKLRGLVNGGKNNCAFNALLQMIFHAPSLLEALLTVPEFKELKTIHDQYFKQQPGRPNTQKIREMLHRIFGDLIAEHNRFEDASEALYLMLSKVTPVVGKRLFPCFREILQYEPTGQTRRLEHSAARGYSLLGAQRSTASALLSDPLIRFDVRAPIDPRDRTGRVHLSEANFSEMCSEAFHAQGDLGEPVWYLGEDSTLLYEHRPIARLHKFQQMPTSLLVSLRRFTHNGVNVEIVSTPMQMPRVLTLPAETVPSDIEDRRLVLRSFVVYQPGHYVCYVKQDHKWYCLDDSSIDEVSIEQIDEALYHYPGGGSYLHYYERGDADTEAPITRQVRDLPEEQADLYQQLERLFTLCNATETSPTTLLEAFDDLPTPIKNTFYGNIYTLESHGRKGSKLGEKLLRADIRLLVKHPLLKKQIETLSTQLEEQLTSQVDIALHLSHILETQTGSPKKWYALFERLDKNYQSIATKLIWENSSEKEKTIPHFGRSAIKENPRRLLDEASQKAKKTSTSKTMPQIKLRIIDHIVNAILDDERIAAIAESLGSIRLPLYPRLEKTSPPSQLSPPAPSSSSSPPSFLDVYTGSSSWLRAFLPSRNK
ncbi:MAG: hypothetical protein KGZ39_06965 [Simkania sp.]|nr:hypothetical protein [Simkania sp.]